MTKILITGANGQLGNEFRKLSINHSDWEFTFTDVDNLDITNFSALESLCNQNQFNYIVNCAAYTAVDKAENDLELATKLNRDAVKNLATVAAQIDAVLIHVSTDYVFNGMACTPYTEDLSVSPTSAYGRTKAQGEEEALKYNKSLVIRTAWLYSTFGNNFVKTMLRLGSDRPEISVVFDQIGTPTYAEDLASAILSIIQNTNTNGAKPGIYHFSNEGVCSWYDFAWEIQNFAQTRCIVKPIESKDYPTPAKRPAFSVFNKSKIKSTFNIDIPYWKTSLYKCLNSLINSN
ncbi:MAG: dTDP-4-dehydrorhamnose reductase [Bacteroidota bacterium]|nr:dTDP-4-dehydrorhamnose reductase [Bacteroidota bacterium]